MKVSENLYVVLLAVLALGVVFITDYFGMPQKWHAAIVGTFLPFGGVAWVFASRWRQRRFWIAMCVCLVFHIVAIWLIFQHAFSGVQNVGILIWAPIAFAEGVLLLGIVRLIERKIP